MENGMCTLSDEELISRACQGDGVALEHLLRRHQAWIFNVALRMLQTQADAEDATQEVLIRIATRLATFRGGSRFRTWAYRIMANHLLDRRRSRPEEVVHDFACYAAYLDGAPSEELQPRYGSPQERHLLILEAQRSCLLGMLLCLDRHQRLVFVLGEIFEVEDAVASQVLGISAENFRQQLSRARRQIYGFVQDKCGLFDPGNPCRCAKKTKAFIRDGIVDPERLVFVEPLVDNLQEKVRREVELFGNMVTSGNRLLYREHPFIEPPDLAERLRKLIGDRDFRASLGLPNSQD